MIGFRRRGSITNKLTLSIFLTGPVCHGQRTLYTVHCRVHCTLVTVHCTVHCTLYTVHCTVNCTLYTVEGNLLVQPGPDLDLQPRVCSYSQHKYLLGDVGDFGMVFQYGIQVLGFSMVLQYDILVWYFSMVFYYNILVWDFILVFQYVMGCNL